jgi:hypothetical protein
MSTDPRPVYHPVIDRILAEHLGGPGAVTTLRRIAALPGCDPLTRLLHQGAQSATERDRQLRRRIRHMANDLHAAAVELAEGRCAEPLLTGCHDELLALAARHRDALTHLDSLARAVAERAAAPAEPSVTP